MTGTSELFTKDIHPRILFGPDDIPVLRRKVASGAAAEALAMMLRRCERFCEPSAREYVDVDTPAKGPVKCVPLKHLAFAWMLTGEARWKDRAIAQMRRVVANGYNDGHGHGTNGPEHLPLAYDILYGELSADDRRRTAEFIRKEIDRFKVEHLDNPIRHVWCLGTNPTLASLLFASYWMAAGYDHARDADMMRKYADMVRRSLHLGIDQGGMIGEGPNYGMFDSFRWAVPAEILRRAGVADLWAQEPALGVMLRWWAYLLLPGRVAINPLHDAGRGHASWPLSAHLLGARRLNDPLLQWLWELFGGRNLNVEPATHKQGHFHDHHGNCELLILWDEPTAKASSPAEVNLPLHYSSGDFGFNVARSGWDDDAMYFCLQASGRTPGVIIHEHVDGGHFSLFSLGEAFSVDTGYGDQQGRYHSVMMPVGKEPPTSPIGFDTAYSGGRTEASAATETADYCRVNIAWQWDCYWNLRHALVVRAPGAMPYVILVDNINYRSTWCFYDWLMQSEPGNRIALNQDQLRADVHGKRHRLEAAWSCPAGYSPPHRIELSQDEIDSEPLDHVGPGKRLGLGVRPRLKARLWAHNGLLMTALMPRRADQPATPIRRFGTPLQFGLVIEHGDVTDTVICNPTDRAIDVENMRGEAAIAVARRDASGKLLWAAAADVFALEVDGKDVFPRTGRAGDLRSL